MLDYKVKKVHGFHGLTKIQIMADMNQNRIHYYVLCVGAFARQKKIPPTDAFNYLYSYKGIDFLVDCYDAEHTLSLDNVVEDLTILCKNNGGTIL